MQRHLTTRASQEPTFRGPMGTIRTLLPHTHLYRCTPVRHITLCMRKLGHIRHERSVIAHNFVIVEQVRASRSRQTRCASPEQGTPVLELRPMDLNGGIAFLQGQSEGT